MHSLSGFEASQVPDAIIGIEHMNAKKFKKAVMLLLEDMFDSHNNFSLLL